MRSKGFFTTLAAVLAVFTVTLLVNDTRAAAQERVLHNFSGKNGSQPYSGLIFDAAGNLYGTTFEGGLYNYGTVFELTPKAGGGWTEKVLHSFNYNGKDGYYPHGSLIFDGNGNLYGTTTYGGSAACSDDQPGGCGTVFELTPKPGGGWAEKILYSFGNGGAYPVASLIFDTVGNLYSTTLEGPVVEGVNAGCGTVFELTPAANAWTEWTLYFNFADDCGPFAGVVFDAKGNLYGTTEGEGAYGGIVYELTPGAGGSWTETTLHYFLLDGTDGYTPAGGLIFDAAGNLYGATVFGGTGKVGTVFELTPTSGNMWTEAILHDFGSGTEEYGPSGSLMFDAAGNLYGATYAGGTYNYGTVFELSPAGDGRWTGRVLHNFNNNGKDAYYPNGSLIFDDAGNLYGTTGSGGLYGNGTVFEITP